MLIYFSEEIILPWAGHYPKFRKKKKKGTQKLHAQDTTSKINILLRQQAHFRFPIATFLLLGTKG